MKIIALTDVHGAYSIVDRILHDESADVLIIGGDLTTVGTIKEAEEVIGRFQSRIGTIMCVAGNMDLPQHDELFERMGVSINGRGVLIGNAGFFGVSAAPSSRLNTPYEIPEEEIERRARAGYEEVKDARVKIFVPHAPPYGTKLDIIHAGFHVGSTAVREFIEVEQPEVVICGHIHEGRGRDTIDRTEIVNCGPAYQGFYTTLVVEDTIRVDLRQCSGV